MEVGFIEKGSIILQLWWVEVEQTEFKRFWA